MRLFSGLRVCPQPPLAHAVQQSLAGDRQPRDHHGFWNVAIKEPPESRTAKERMAAIHVGMLGDEMLSDCQGTLRCTIAPASSDARGGPGSS